METASYDQELRAIGQALESQGISTFQLKIQSGRYVVSGVSEKPESLTAALRQWRHNWRRGARTVTFAAKDIMLLEQKGRARRALPNQIPDFHSLSNILRTVGAYLDAKNARLIEIHKRPLTLTLLYQTPGDKPQTEDRTIVSFHKTFVELQGQRTGARR